MRQNKQEQENILSFPSLTANFLVWGRPELAVGRNLKVNEFWSFNNVLDAKRNLWVFDVVVVKSNWKSHEIFWRLYPGAGQHKLKELVSQDGDGQEQCCFLFLPFQVLVSLLSQFCMDHEESFGLFTEPVLYGPWRVFLAEKCMYVFDPMHPSPAVSPRSGLLPLVYHWLPLYWSWLLSPFLEKHDSTFSLATAVFPISLHWKNLKLLADSGSMFLHLSSAHSSGFSSPLHHWTGSYRINSSLPTSQLISQPLLMWLTTPPSWAIFFH